MDRTGRLIARILGGMSLAFGIAATVLAVWAIDRQFAVRGVVQVSGALAGVVFLLIAAFCVLVGYRLLFNRPNRNDLVLSRSGWALLALSFWVVGFTLAAIGLGRGKYQLLAVAVGLSVFGIASMLAGRAVSRKLLFSPVLPAGTSLLEKKEFVPAGFVSGVEIMNDDRTPMEFVVSVLRLHLNLSEAEAIRIMLEIHTKGGALLPLTTFDEAARAAELIAQEAKTKDHPLVCRAVTVTDAVCRQGRREFLCGQPME